MIIVDFEKCFISILLGFFFLICYSFLFKKPNNRGDLPPSPPSLPIIGHLHHFISALSSLKSLEKLSTKYGRFLYLRIFNVPIVLVSSATTAYEIFRAHDLNVSSRLLPLMEESLFLGSFTFTMAPYGDYCKFVKKIIATKLLGPQALERSKGVRALELELFYANLLDKATKKESVEIHKEAMKLSNNNVCKMIMGRSCSEENGEADKALGLIVESTSVFKKIFFAILLRKPLEKLGISLFKKEIDDLSSRFDHLLEKIIVEHEEKLNHHHGTDMTDALLEAIGDENAECEITRNHIKSLFVEIFLAGTDGPAQTTQWTMAEILNKPHIFQKLREEIDSVVGKTRLIQERDLPNLPYLQAVVKEGLRLHPPPFLIRTFREGCNVEGCYVPEKTTLVVNNYAIMRDPDYWEDPDEYKPERFLTSSGLGQEDERSQALKYIPFGSGRRGCPGVNLGYIFVETSIGVMVQCFDWIIKGENVNMEGVLQSLTLTMLHPLSCTPVARIQPLTTNLDKSMDSHT